MPVPQIMKNNVADLRSFTERTFERIVDELVFQLQECGGEVDTTGTSARASEQRECVFFSNLVELWSWSVCPSGAFSRRIC